WCPAESFVAVRGVRLAITAHTGDWLQRDLPWANELRYYRLRLRWRLFYWAVRKNGALVLTVSDFLRKRLIERIGLPEANVRVVGHGVEDVFFKAGDNPLPDEVRALQPYFLIAGGLSIYKGGDRAIAVTRLMPDITFVAVGDESPCCDVPPN